MLSQPIRLQSYYSPLENVKTYSYIHISNRGKGYIACATYFLTDWMCGIFSRCLCTSSLKYAEPVFSHNRNDNNYVCNIVLQRIMLIKCNLYVITHINVISYFILHDPYQNLSMRCVWQNFMVVNVLNHMMKHYFSKRIVIAKSKIQTFNFGKSQLY